MGVKRHFTTKGGTELPLIDLKGKEYLQVADRLIWFREEKPLWTISTAFLKLDEKVAIAKAEISDEQGRVISTAHKTETPGGFADFVEKAETGAIGRALAMIGYGTQFCADEFDEGERVVDSPRETAKPALKQVPMPKAVPAPIEEPEVVVDFGQYVIPFGKHKGKRLEDMDVYVLDSWAEYMRTQPQLSENAKEAVMAAESYIKTRLTPNARAKL